MKGGSLLLIVLVALHCHLSSSISFDLPADAKKCLQEEVHKDVLVVGEYKLSDVQGIRTDLKVLDHHMHNIILPIWYVNDTFHQVPMYQTDHCFLQVADSKGHILYSQEDASKGKFAFTTDDYDMFEICFHSTVTGTFLWGEVRSSGEGTLLWGEVRSSGEGTLLWGRCVPLGRVRSSGGGGAADSGHAIMSRKSIWWIFGHFMGS